jgi:hypothetical protein
VAAGIDDVCIAYPKIVTMLNEQQEWPDTGVYAA